jgi:hypothetical protein
MVNERKRVRNDEAERRRRAAARRHWPVSVHRLGEEPGDDLSATTTAEERLAMVWPLTLAAWRLAGRELPSYARAEMPVRVIRGSVGRGRDREGES